MEIDDDDIAGALQQILRACQQRKLQRNKEAFDRIVEIIDTEDDQRLKGDELKLSLKRKYEAAVSILLLLADPPGHRELDLALEKISAATKSTVEGVRIVGGRPDGYSLYDVLEPPRELNAEGRAVLSFFRERVMHRNWSVGQERSPDGGNGGE
ncbi:MAG: hypothetical protein EON54_00990 [Alcaligenaceae bacterium]|nr:MAG: hypothetical protein EON54_00990 [Alcaligenaceae bacterium]